MCEIFFPDEVLKVEMVVVVGRKDCSLSLDGIQQLYV
jgi:hypothetical protein